MAGWINAPDKESKQKYELTDEIKHAIDRF